MWVGEESGLDRGEELLLLVNTSVGWIGERVLAVGK